MIPDIGQFRFNLILWRPVQSATTTGQAGYSFIQAGTVKCHAKSVRGKLSDDGVQEMAGKRTYRFIIRHYSTLDYGWELTYEGVKYRIERIDNWDERDRFQIIYAVEVDL